MKIARYVALSLLVPATVWAVCSLKVWNQGDTLKAADLNSNFSCINSQVAANGSIVDAQINSAAAIQLSKLASSQLIPRAWGTIIAACVANGACTVTGSGVSISRTALGTYTATLSVTRADSNYGTQIGAGQNSVGGLTSRMCVATPTSTTQISIACFDQTGAAADVGFTLTIMDDELGSNGF